MDIFCPLCNSIAKNWKDLNGYTIASCINCKTRFLNPMPTDTELKTFYNNYLTHYPKHGNDNPEIRSMQKYYEEINRERLDKILAATTSSPRETHETLLDLGCASGLFIRNAIEYGFKADGVEISPEEASQSRKQNPDSTIYEDHLEKLNIPDNSYDVVTAWDILEHIPDQQKFLSEITRILRPGGIFAASTINISALNHTLFGIRWGFYIPPEHVLFYSASGLRDFVISNGFALHRYDTLYAPQLTISSLLNFLPSKKTDIQKGFNAPPNIAILYIKKYLTLPVNFFLRKTSVGDIIEFYAAMK